MKKHAPLWLGSLLVIGLIGFATHGPSQDSRYGLNMYAQESEPVPLAVGHQWFKPSTLEQRMAVALNPTVWRFTNGGIGNATPTLSGCGISPTLVSGSTDSAGVVNIGTGVTTGCTVTFGGQPFPSSPSCVLQPESTTVLASPALSVSALVVSLSLSLGGGKLHYHCDGTW